MQSHSRAHMHQVYSEYLNNALEQYKEQPAKVIERGQAVAEHIEEISES